MPEHLNTYQGDPGDENPTPLYGPKHQILGKSLESILARERSVLAHLADFPGVDIALYTTRFGRQPRIVAVLKADRMAEVFSGAVNERLTDLGTENEWDGESFWESKLVECPDKTGAQLGRDILQGFRRRYHP